MAENTQRFQLAHTSTMFHKDVIPLIELCGQNYLAQTIVSNKAELQSDNEELNHFISLLHKDDPIEINTRVEVDRWKSHWNKITEKTASSLYDLHFGYCKAMIGAH